MDNILIQFCGLAEDMMNYLFVMNRDDKNKVSASWSTTILKHYIEGYVVISYLLKKATVLIKLSQSYVLHSHFVNNPGRDARC